MVLLADAKGIMTKRISPAHLRRAGIRTRCSGAKLFIMKLQAHTLFVWGSYFCSPPGQEKCYSSGAANSLSDVRLPQWLPFTVSQQNRLLFLQQLSSWDDQSKGDSVFVERLIIPPLSGMTTVCMLIASFQDHFSTSFTSTKNSLRGRFNIRVWLDVKMRPNTATMWHLDAIISN